MPCPIVTFWDNNLFCKTKICGDSTSALFSKIIIASFSTVYIIVSFEPLNELKIVLIFCFDQLFYFNIPLDSNFVECILQQFHIAHELIIILRFPVDLRNGYLPWMNDVNHLAVHSAGSKLLDFGQVQLS